MAMAFFIKKYLINFLIYIYFEKQCFFYSNIFKYHAIFHKNRKQWEQDLKEQACKV